MTLDEKFALLGGRYDSMLKRLRSAAMIEMLLNDFLEDEEFQKLEAALADHDDETAFRAAHTLKGVSLNMEFGTLAASASALTEALRGGRKPEADALFEQVKKDYIRTVEVIRLS